MFGQTLMDAEKREIYDKLGPEAAASKTPINENTMLLEVCVDDASGIRTGMALYSSAAQGLMM